MKIKKRKLFLIIFFILILLIIFLHFSDSKTKKVCIENKCFSVEITDTYEKMSLGLGERNSLENSSGMLFIFNEETIPGFWMKGMRFPLDIIWIDENRKIIGIEKNLQSCGENCPVYYPEKNVKYVLEINANVYDFKIGDEVGLRK